MKKSEVRELLISIYGETASNYRAIGSQKVSLMGSGIFGLGFLVTFGTFFYYLAKDNILSDVRVIWFSLILILLAVSLFCCIAWYFLFLHKLQRIHWVTSACLENLLKDLITGKKDEIKVINEICELLPQLRLSEKYGAKNKKWFKNSLITDEELRLLK